MDDDLRLDTDGIRDDIYRLRLIIGGLFISGADNLALQAATAVLRGREKRLRHLEQTGASA